MSNTCLTEPKPRPATTELIRREPRELGSLVSSFFLLNSNSAFVYILFLSGLNHRALDHPYWPKVSPDSAENMHDYPGDIPRQILEQNDDLVIIRQQLGQNPPAPPSTPSSNLSNSYDTTITKTNANSAFTPISSMSGHLNLNHQLAPNR